jgi:signal transduction histidine kinase
VTTLLGGTIRVESGPAGKGTVFVLDLPLRAVQVPEPAAPQSATLPSVR